MLQARCSDAVMRVRVMWQQSSWRGEGAAKAEASSKVGVREACEVTDAL